MSPRLRFSILVRDRFTCRYCGRSAPAVILHVDHVHPQSLGGEDTEENLVTACEDCNSGKGHALIFPMQADPETGRDLWRYTEEYCLRQEWHRAFPGFSVWKAAQIREFLMRMGPDQVRFEVDYACCRAKTHSWSSRVAWTSLQSRLTEAVQARKQKEERDDTQGYWEAWQAGSRKPQTQRKTA